MTKWNFLKISIRRGGCEPSEINIAVDARYNSMTTASRKKPGQNASQAIGIACETMTDREVYYSGWLPE